MTKHSNLVRAYVPEGLVLDETCPVRHGVWMLLGLIYWKHMDYRIQWEKPVRLKYDYLYENIPDWPSVWKWCSSKGLVNRTEFYKRDKESYGYWTNRPYCDQTHRLVHFEDKVVARRHKDIESKTLSRPILEKLRKQLDRLTVDMPLFQRRFGTHPDRHYYQAHLQTLLDKQIRFKKDEFSGRIHTNITNLYKQLRALLRVDGQDEPLVELDIRNSQPLFLAIAALKAKVQDKKYLELCESGQLYDYLALELGMSRDSAKKELMLYYFAKNGHRSVLKELKQLFEKQFDSIASYLTKIKSKDHKRAAKQMQMAERQLIIDNVCVKLFQQRKDLFVTTVHDSLLVRKSDSDLAEAVLMDEFMKLGVNPGLRRTILE